MVGKHLRNPLLLISIAAPLVLSGCQDSHAESAATAPPPPGVEVAQVLIEKVTELDEYSGRLESPQTVTVMPRVSGYVDKVHFQEGSAVEAGDVLFSIDNRLFVAEVTRLKAELSSAQTSLNQAIKDYERAQRLSKTKAISQETVDARFADKQRSIASVSALKAALAQAELDLEFTLVRAPIDGKVSNAEITKGNYVTTGQTVLTSLVSTSHMYAYFDVDERSYLKYQQLNNLLPANGEAENVVQMALANDTGYPHVGYIDFVDNAIDETTGTIRVRAVFDNEKQNLLPGMFAKLRIAGSASYQGVLIDNKAIGTDLNNKYVLVLGDDNVVQYRAISLGEGVNGLRIIASGLNAGDKIVVNGLQRVRANMPVTPNEVSMVDENTLASIRQQQALLDQQRNELLTLQVN
ncbi:MexE family multidrug efflux RND transporter periplasmic adaptor subunit [Vibrio coralliilyticus]|uniref:efflux RND transporter periplasmic adaptor subunit n=1 Tax=Vibrio coralliilyticus TaxID=190893 RepID=UPI0005127D89|nr:efflux RND transporter periplasmic adaptor subunit [Vibrio coralliilyticus]AIU67674.1 RND transporter MFP subunit [Vibrio coralliilyticus]ARC91484.1 MexE family multidrug efflux RND transporter periplasmic adaptor subunit [Vibrio coralliilyticus]AXN32564.1 efflux RND transporter periplasmic adaptor subunit [Vibrio coralliilyticus]KPH25914.1 RND transporter MFP subunit [Vibrio coralliilyticus]PAU37632.1 MexE family multidrug efflux RND transporter periplasmic adaptor subunit [Vibrio corallii